MLYYSIDVACVRHLWFPPLFFRLISRTCLVACCLGHISHGRNVHVNRVSRANTVNLNAVFNLLQNKLICSLNSVTVAIMRYDTCAYPPRRIGWWT